MIRRRISTLVILVSGALAFSAAAQQLTPETFTCEKAFGPGYTQHPDFPFSCCWPGLVPVPGEPRCAKPGQEGAAAPSGSDEAAGQQPGGNVTDAEGREGAPGGHCIPHGATCTLNGAPCCSGADTCSGKFPNTVCQ